MIVDRAHGRGMAQETPIAGCLSTRYRLERLDYPKEKFAEMQPFDRAAWRSESDWPRRVIHRMHDHSVGDVYERELSICSCSR